MIYKDFEFVPGAKPGAIIKWRENPDEYTWEGPAFEQPSCNTFIAVGVITECGHRTDSLGLPYLKAQLVCDSNKVYDFWPESFDKINLVTDRAQLIRLLLDLNRAQTKV